MDMLLVTIISAVFDLLLFYVSGLLWRPQFSFIYSNTIIAAGSLAFAYFSNRIGDFSLTPLENSALIFIQINSFGFMFWWYVIMTILSFFVLPLFFGVRYKRILSRLAEDRNIKFLIIVAFLSYAASITLTAGCKLFLLLTGNLIASAAVLIVLKTIICIILTLDAWGLLLLIIVSLKIDVLSNKKLLIILSTLVITGLLIWPILNYFKVVSLFTSIVGAWFFMLGTLNGLYPLLCLIIIKDKHWKVTLFSYIALVAFRVFLLVASTTNLFATAAATAGLFLISAIINNKVNIFDGGIILYLEKIFHIKNIQGEVLYKKLVVTFTPKTSTTLILPEEHRLVLRIKNSSKVLDFSRTKYADLFRYTRGNRHIRPRTIFMNIHLLEAMRVRVGTIVNFNELAQVQRRQQYLEAQRLFYTQRATRFRQVFFPERAVRVRLLDRGGAVSVYNGVTKNITHKDILEQGYTAVLKRRHNVINTVRQADLAIAEYTLKRQRELESARLRQRHEKLIASCEKRESACSIKEAANLKKSRLDFRNRFSAQLAHYGISDSVRAHELLNEQRRYDRHNILYNELPLNCYSAVNSAGDIDAIMTNESDWGDMSEQRDDSARRRQRRSDRSRTVSNVRQTKPFSVKQETGATSQPSLCESAEDADWEDIPESEAALYKIEAPAIKEEAITIKTERPQVNIKEPLSNSVVTAAKVENSIDDDWASVSDDAAANSGVATPKSGTAATVLEEEKAAPEKAETSAASATSQVTENPLALNACNVGFLVDVPVPTFETLSEVCTRISAIDLYQDFLWLESRKYVADVQALRESMRFALIPRVSDLKIIAKIAEPVTAILPPALRVPTDFGFYLTVPGFEYLKYDMCIAIEISRETGTQGRAASDTACFVRWMCEGAGIKHISDEVLCGNIANFLENRKLYVDMVVSLNKQLTHAALGFSKAQTLIKHE